MSHSILNTLRDKGILITGTTGFVGKVLVEKILRDVPEVGKLYLLIRGDSQARLQKDILSSKIFTR
jgi:thioester reductase-like protein